MYNVMIWSMYVFFFSNYDLKVIYGKSSLCMLIAEQ